MLEESELWLENVDGTYLVLALKKVHIWSPY